MSTDNKILSLTDKINQKKAELEAEMKELERLQKEEERTKIKNVDINIASFDFRNGLVEIKLSEFRPDVVDALRTTPTRFYNGTTNFIREDYLEYFLNIKAISLPNVNLIIKDGLLTKVDEYRNTPDYLFTLDHRKSKVEVKLGPKGREKYIQEISTWRFNQTSRFYTFEIAELYKLPNVLSTYFSTSKYELDEEVKSILNKQIAKIKELEEIQEAKDAPEIESPFPEFDLTNDQRVGVKFAHATNDRTIFAYDMGKGKTALAAALAEFNNERILFVCKASLKTNIKREIKKFTGKDAIVFSGVEPDNMSVRYLFEDKRQYNIINYDVIGRGKEEKDKYGTVIHEVMPWVEIINLSQFDWIVYDECHYMKNIESKRSRAGRALKAPKVALLSGTPLVNRPAELYPALNIVAPEVFNNYAYFVQNYSDGKNGVKNLSSLREILKQYMIVRKNEGLDIKRITHSIELSSMGRSLYNKALEGLYISLRSGKQSDITSILTQLLRLKQIIAEDAIDSTVDLAEDALDQTEKKVLVFSQFKLCHAEISKRLGKTARVINGDITDTARYEIVDKFQEKTNEVNYIVTNITEGLTLTEAHTTIFNDLWWTPKDHRQAEGRAFGRTNDYHGGNSYYSSTENTISQMIEALLNEKLNTSKQVIDGEGVEDNQLSMVNELIKQLRLSM